MKIAYINSFYAPDEVGGAEKSVRFLAETVVANGHEATVITLGRTRESTELNGVRIERLPIQNLYFATDAGSKSSLQKLAWHTLDSYNPLAGRTIGKLIDQLKPDVVHTNNLGGFSVSAWSAVASRNIPVVHTLRDYYLLCPNTAMFKDGKPCESRCGKCKLMGTPRAHATSHVSHVVGNSQFILDKHLQYGLFEGAQQSVIYNAYEPKSLTPNKQNDTVTFGFIGRLAPTKGVEVLIDAAKQLAQEVPANSFRVLIAGDGEPDYVAALKSRSANLPISFLGRTKPEDLYNACDWTVLPSIWDEPLARVLFESFAHGVPVIGSQTGGTPELLTHTLTGRIYNEPRNPRSLSVEMKAALSSYVHYENLQKSCGTLAIEFKPQNTFAKYLSTYKSAANFKPKIRAAT
jgi:glycosyltransferase involved in cell wall biosynthesis